MTLRRLRPAFWLFVLTALCFSFSDIALGDGVPQEGAQKESNAETSIRVETERGLRAWFTGRAAEAENIFSRLVKDNCQNPLPYHALAILLSEQHKDYTTIAELYSRHKVLSAKNEQDYAESIELIKEYAESGSPQAQLLLARICGWGLDGTLNLYRSMLWLRRAADGGYDQANRDLGVMYEYGTGVEKNVCRAAQLYTLAAVQGDLPAVKCLAVLSLSGSLGQNKKHGALKLLERAAQAGLPEAQLVLAHMYHDGIVHPKNIRKSVAWYKKAAENGNADAMEILACLFEKGEGVTKSPQSALKWHREAAKNGNDEALFRLGVLHYTGTFLKADHAEAFRCFKQAAQFGNAAAWYNVAFMLKTGDGTTQDSNESVKWFKRSAMTGNSQAQMNLGVMYANGDGVETDLEEAHFWFELARLCGNTDAGQGIEHTSAHLDEAAIDRAVRRAQNTYKRLQKYKIQ